MKPLLALLAIMAVVSACGGSSSAAKASSTTTSSTTAAASRIAFRQCMASHGINLTTRSSTSTTSGSQPNDNGGGGSGGGGGGGGGFGGGGRFLQPPPGVDPTAYQAALSACRSLLPTGGGGGAQFRTAMIAYVNCLKSHGVQTGNPTLGAQALSGVDRTSPTFTAAAQACRALLPQRSGATTSTTAAG